MNPKQRAALAALQFVKSNMVVGLGTGSTADFFLVELAKAIQAGELTGIRGLPTSRQSEKRATTLGIPLVTFAQVQAVDVTIDGADEVDPNLDMIKGLGGALLREKIVAQNSRRMVIIADEAKMVRTLGSRSPLPVEVTPFAFEAHGAFLRSLGAQPSLRIGVDGKVFITDNGNYIYDCRFESIEAPVEMDKAIRSRAGIVETGLFLGLASVAIIGTDKGVQEIKRSSHFWDTMGMAAPNQAAE